MRPEGEVLVEVLHFHGDLAGGGDNLLRGRIDVDQGGDGLCLRDEFLIVRNAFIFRFAVLVCKAPRVIYRSDSLNRAAVG